MSYPEKKSLVNMVSTVAIFGLYCVYVYQQYLQSGSLITQGVEFWLTAFFVLIPVSIVAHIAISIVFSIVYAVTTKEKEPVNLDEFDRLIELKATQVSHWLMVLAILASVATLYFQVPVQGMLIVLSFSLMLSSLVHDIVKLVLYRRGV